MSSAVLIMATLGPGGDLFAVVDVAAFGLRASLIAGPADPGAFAQAVSVYGPLN